MSAAVQDIHHRTGKTLCLGPAKIAKEEKIFRGRSGVRDRQENASSAFAPGSFIGVPSSSISLLSIFLVPRIPAFRAGAILSLTLATAF